MTENDPYLPKLHELLTSQKTLQGRLAATLSRPGLEELDLFIVRTFGFEESLREANRTKSGAQRTYLARMCFIYLAVGEFYYVHRQVAEHLQMHERSMVKSIKVVKRWLQDSVFAEKMWKFKQQVMKKNI